MADRRELESKMVWWPLKINKMIQKLLDVQTHKLEHNDDNPLTFPLGWVVL
jgi:hypothetical protein